MVPELDLIFDMVLSTVSNPFPAKIADVNIVTFSFTFASLSYPVLGKISIR